MVSTLPFTSAHAHPAVIVPVQATAAAGLAGLVAKAHTSPGIDALEWRVDALDAVARLDGVEPETDAWTPAWEALLDELHACFRMLAGFTIPVLATVRTAAEGGPVALSENAYTLLTRELITAGPAAVDVEYRRRDSAELYAQAREHGIATVASFHDFSATPQAAALEELLVGMERAGATVAKYAVTPGSVADVLRVLDVEARATGAYRGTTDGLVGIPVIAIAMDRLGQITRIAGEFGTAATFAALDGGSAPGQLSVSDTLEIFRARGLRD